VFRLDSTERYKGNLDLTALQDQLARDPGAIACVCIEVCDNATGGGAVSLQHLRDVKALLEPHSIPLILDATRILENAQLVIENEPAHAGKTIWVVARELLACADVVVAGLTKDFCITKGGLICSNDELLMRKLQDLLEQEGGGLNVIEKKLIGLGLRNRKHIEGQVLRRMETVRSVWQALQRHDVPVSSPVGGHCVLIDIKRLPEFQGLKKPVASFLAWMYLNAGIRAGAHSVGMQQAPVLQDQVRLAIPVGMPPEQVATLIDRLVALFGERKNIPELDLEGPAIASLGDIHTRYRVLKYHRVA
jgi:tryptophanase